MPEAVLTLSRPPVNKKPHKNAVHPADPKPDQIVTLFGGTNVDCSEAVSEYISG